MSLKLRKRRLKIQETRMEYDSDEEIGKEELSNKYQGPSIEQIKTFRKEFAKRLKWRKSNSVTPFILIQEKRKLREFQEINMMSLDLSDAALKIDLRKFQQKNIVLRSINENCIPNDEKRTKKPAKETYFQKQESSDNESNDDFFNSENSNRQITNTKRSNAPKRAAREEKSTTLQKSAPRRMPLARI